MTKTAHGVQHLSGIIYIAFDAHEILRYVGKTHLALASRVSRHLTEARNPKTKASHRINWLRSMLHRGESPRFQILQQFAVCTLSELNAAECYWISYFRALGVDLVNATDGGDGIVGYRHTPETRQQLSNTRTGRKRTPFTKETRALMAAAAKQRAARPDEQQAKAARMQKIMLGNRRRHGCKDDFSTRIKKSRAHKGLPFVDQYGNRYETQREAARQLNLSQGDIGRVLVGKYTQIKGYVFRYICE